MNTCPPVSVVDSFKYKVKSKKSNEQPFRKLKFIDSDSLIKKPKKQQIRKIFQRLRIVEIHEVHSISIRSKRIRFIFSRSSLSLT